MSRLCLDTTGYSHFKRGTESVVALLDSAEWIGVPCVVIGELWTGFLQGEHLQRNEAGLADFLSNPVVEQPDIDHEVARI